MKLKFSMMYALQAAAIRIYFSRLRACDKNDERNPTSAFALLRLLILSDLKINTILNIGNLL